MLRLSLATVFLTGGEPLLRRDLETIAATASDLGLTVGVGTNGWALTTKRAQSLAQAGVTRLQISLDGLAATHDKIRGRRGLFDRSRRAIYSSQTAGMATKVCFTVHRLNWHELQPLFDFALSMGVDGFNLSQLVPTGRGDASMDLTPREWRGVLEWWNVARRENPSVTMTTHLAQLALVAPELTRTPLFHGCQAARGQGAISPTGDIYPCVVLPYRMGNLRESSFKEIWNYSSTALELRDRTQLRGACGQCRLRDKCGGCRATAYALTGDLMASDPHCWISDQEDSGLTS